MRADKFPVVIVTIVTIVVRFFGEMAPNGRVIAIVRR
jgi:hypothetical protein